MKVFNFFQAGLGCWLDLFMFFISAIGNAFSVLSDPVKRKRYDQFGSEEEKSVHNHHSNYHEYDYTRGFEGRDFHLVTASIYMAL